MPRSPLDSLHTELGARLVDFGGWEMPVQYQGVLAEHEAVRSRAGVFDVSHLGRFGFRGPGATAVVRRLLCNDIARIEPGRAQYTMMLNSEGGVEDDIIVWRLDDDDYIILPNGANYERVLVGFRDEAPSAVAVEPLREHTVLLAVQGPDAPDLCDKVLGWRPRRFRLDRFDLDGHPVTAAGTGYTGERGGELITGAAAGRRIVQLLLEAGAVPCGLGARDTLRLEMAYPLWGQDLDPATTPLEAELEWVVDWEHDFVGRAALAAQRRRGLTKRRVAFVVNGRQIARHGHPLRAAGGGGVSTSGVVTSGNFSPGVGRGIGLGYLSPYPSAVERVEVQVRNRWIPADVVETPFIEVG